MIFRTFDHKEDFIKQSVLLMTNVCNAPEGDIYLCLAGGTTPIPVYEQCCHEDIPFDRVHLFLTDERYVTQNHSALNASMIQKTISTDLVPWASVNTFDTELSIKEALDAYEKALRQVPDGVFDLMVLGIGEDGHIASLFPCSPCLDETAPVCHSQSQKHFISDRLTITPPVIMKAKKILVLLSGEQKQPVLEELTRRTRDKRTFPAHLLQQHPDVVVHYLL